MGAKAPTETRVQENTRRSASPAQAETISPEAVPATQIPLASFAPASPGNSQTAFNSIVQRAQQFTSAALSAQQAKSTPASSQQPLAFGTIQRKSSLVTPVTTLGKESSWFNMDKYDAVVDEVTEYMNDGKTPEAGYGKRMLKLKEIDKKIDGWVAENGSLDKAPGWIATQTDKRRALLKTLKTSLAPEDAKLQTDGLNASFARHEKDREFLQQCLDLAAASDERMLKNTAEWFALGKANLYAITPTGDAEARLTLAGKDPVKDQAYFPTADDNSPGSMTSTPVKYNEKNLADQTNVKLYPGGANVEGFNRPGTVAITCAFGRTKEYIWETLRHEVQHDADWNKGRDSGAGVHAAGKEFDDSGAGVSGDQKSWTGTSGQKSQGHAAYLTQQAEIALTRYKTEYRAYSYEAGPGGTYNALDNSVKNQVKDGKNFTARQLAIFNQIYAGYKYTKDNWDADTPLTGGRSFKDEVVKYFNPDDEAFNRYNSAKVDDFYRALDAIGVKEAATKLQPFAGPRDVAPVESGKEIDATKDPLVVKLLDVARTLSTEDATYILHESPAMLKKMGKHLKGAALEKVKETLEHAIDPSLLRDFFSLFED